MHVLFTDFDGTLVNENRPICEKNKEMMEKLHDEGHMIVICTGRNYMEFMRDNERLQFPYDYLILNNGGYIIDSDEQVVIEKTISKEVGIDILNYITKIPHMWSYFCDGYINYGCIDGKVINHIDESECIEGSFRDYYETADSFQIIAFNQDNEKVDESEKCYQYIKEHYGDEVEAYFNLHYVDVVPKGCSKGNGMYDLLEVCPYIDYVYAIGDSYNDVSMLEKANFGYTFHHAAEDIKKVIPNHVSYVYEVIEKILENK